MKKQKIFRADGATLGGVNASSGTFSVNDRAALLEVYLLYSGAHQGVNNAKTVRVHSATKSKITKDQAESLVSLLSKAGINVKNYDRTGNTDNALILKINDKEGAKKATSAVLAILKLAEKVQSLDETYTIDQRYPSGMAISATSGTVSVSYRIPYNKAAAEQARTEASQSATVQLQQAEADSATAAAALAAEEAARKTAMGKTLRIVGIAAIAALVIGAVVLVIVKTKKK